MPFTRPSAFELVCGAASCATNVRGIPRGIKKSHRKNKKVATFVNCSLEPLLSTMDYFLVQYGSPNLESSEEAASPIVTSVKVTLLRPSKV